MRQNRFFIVLLLIILGLSACSSQTQALSGKYCSVYNSEIYYTFSGEQYYTNNLWEDISITDSGNGTYVNKDKKIIIYINGDENYQYELGYIYKEYICSLWDGILPMSYCEATITNILGDLILKFNFKKDKSYEYTVTSNNEIVHTEIGTYTVNDNKVVCIGEDGITTTFISAEGKVFSIEYIKE